MVKYISKSFAKCQTLDERIFIEKTLIEIAYRCKERGILFSRDWENVTNPYLNRESPNAYVKINQMIMNGDQGVI